MTLDEFQRMTFQWSIKTFGVRPAAGPIAHLKAECDEIIAEPLDITEYADAFLLLQDGAARAGFKMSEVFEAAQRKHMINEDRDWGDGEANEQGFTEHVDSCIDPDCRQ